jgi:tetratricopeptide (TPR) repeat protein
MANHAQQPRLWIDHGALHLRFADGSSEQRPFGQADATMLGDCARRYSSACKLGRDQDLLPIGRELGSWLEGHGNWLGRLIDELTRPPLVFEVAARIDAETEERLLLAAPWELVIAPRSDQFLAGQRPQWAPVRCLVPPRKLAAFLEPTPTPARALSVLFMAAAPHGYDTLSYEEEELAILDATRPMRRELADLVVEETGTVQELAVRLAEDTQHPPQVLHISCHGRANPPELVLESEQGEPAPASAAALYQALGNPSEQLLFLSACETAAGTTTDTAHSLTHELVRQGFCAALGWGGSVRDNEATVFARELYGRLALGDRVPTAVAAARLQLLARVRAESETRRNDWHMARLTLGQRGGGSLAQANGEHRQRANTGRAFLDPRRRTVPVASPKEFVGRRRELQQLIREVRSRPREHAGILVRGVGGQGKSSLVARLDQRLHDHKVVVLHGVYTPQTVWERLDEADGLRGQAPTTVDAAQLEVRLRTRLLSREGAPLLIVFDDFEQVLERQPGALHRIKDPEALSCLRALVRSFAAQPRTDSALIVTSRFPFALPDTDGIPLEARLLDLPLAGMRAPDARKQALALGLAPAAESDGSALVNRAAAVTGGNAALNALLLRTIRAECESQSVRAPGEGQPTTPAERLIQALEQKQPELAADAELTAELQRLAVGEMLSWLPQSQRQFLELWPLLFRGQVPVVALEALSKAAQDVLAFRRDCFGPELARLGFLEPGALAGFESGEVLQLNGLVRLHLAEPQLLPEQRADLLRAYVPELHRVLAKRGAATPTGEALDWLRLALQASHFDLARDYGHAALTWLGASFSPTERDARERAATVAVDTMTLVGNGAALPPCLLARGAARLAEHFAEPALIHRWLEQAASVAEQELAAGELPLTDACDVLRDHARALTRTGKPREALALLERLNTRLEGSELHFDLAATRGDIARIYAQQGQPQQALALHEQQRQMFEALGDRHSLAVTLGDIARIYLQQGQPQQALALHEQTKRTCEALGDQRGLAITLGDIAHIYRQWGQPQQALALHEQEKRTYEALGDQRSLAITLGDIARIYRKQGQPQQALALHEQQRQMFEALGDQRALAITLGDIARIYAAEDRLADAKSLQSKRLATNRQLGDQDGIAAASWDLAQLALQEGNGDEAFRLAVESFGILVKLDRADGIAVVGSNLGEWLCAAEQWEPAVRVLEPALAMAERMQAHRLVQRTRASLERARAGLGTTSSSETEASSK